MTTEERRRPAVGIQIKKWRTERGMTLANVAERSGLNVGYLSQIENDKASPSLQCLTSIATRSASPPRGSSSMTCPSRRSSVRPNGRRR